MVSSILSDVCRATYISIGCMHVVYIVAGSSKLGQWHKETSNDEGVDEAVLLLWYDILGGEQYVRNVRSSYTNTRYAPFYNCPWHTKLL